MTTNRRLTTFILSAWACLTGVSAQQAALVVNEVMVGNIEQFMSPAYNFDGWIELYNSMNSDFPLGGLYLSDEADNPRKWKMPVEMPSVPAGGHLQVWMGSSNLRNVQCPFKLDADGGSLYLSDAGGHLITQADYPESMERAAWARTTDGGNEWAWTATPTPGATNNGATYAEQQLEAPVVLPASRLFDTPSIAVLPTIPEGCTLRYTEDGTLPTLENGRTAKGIFLATKTCVLRFRLFRDGWIPSPVTTRSYIRRDKDYQLPVVSIVSDPAFLYDDEIGIAVVGTNGRPGNHRSEPCNFNMDWDRPVSVQYVTTEGEQLNRDVNITMSGAYSRTLTPHNFKLKGNKKYGGNKNLEYPFFEAKPYIRNRTVLLRNGGNDIDCRIKDALVHTLIQTSGIDIDVQSYQPIHEFVNGEYQGVLNMREPSNKHYAYANYGWGDDEIDAFEINIDSAYVQSCGTQEAMDRLHQLSSDAASPDSYEEIKRLLDIDEFVNYMAMCMYTGRTDWPHNNYKGFRLHDGGRFRMIPNDMDVAFSTSTPFTNFANERIYHFQYLYDKQTSKVEEIKPVTIFLNLLQNDDFRRRFIATYGIMGGSVFEPSRCHAVIDSLTARVEPMMRLEGRSCLGSANSFRNAIDGRLTAMTSALRSYQPMRLTGTTAQTVKILCDAPQARLLIDGIEVPTRTFNGKLFAPTRIATVPPAGYVFKGWELEAVDATALIPRSSDWNYYDHGTPPDGWTDSGYTLNGWSLGKAPLGYNKDGLGTVISYGTDAANKRPVYYFRKTLFLGSLPADDEQLRLDYTADDGFIVYVNGQEAARYNLTGDATYADTNAKGDPDRGSVVLDKGLFHQGINVLAVELHNCSATSSDIYWDAQLVKAPADEAVAPLYSTEQEIDLPESAELTLTARYEPMPDAARRAQGVMPVCVNEVSAANSIYVDDYYKRGDWVELYNTTDDEVDVAGMFLSAAPAQPRKYALSAEGSAATTRIAPHGCLLVWCDKKEPLTALHAPFKLSASGGTLVLTAADGSWSDRLDYAAHDGTCSVGRYPDGAAEVYLMTTPTIARANVRSSYSEWLYDTATGIDQPAAVEASTMGLRVNYALGQLSLRGNVVGQADVRIYTLDGRLALRRAVSLHDGFAALSVESLPQGMYVARCVDGQGHAASCKFMR